MVSGMELMTSEDIDEVIDERLLRLFEPGLALEWFKGTRDNKMNIKGTKSSVNECRHK